MSVSELSFPTPYGEVSKKLKRIAFLSGAAVLFVSALILSYGVDLSPGFF